MLSEENVRIGEALLTIQNICRNCVDCNNCPFWDDGFEYCKITNRPDTWDCEDFHWI
jgi:hypothetical protein